jgi:hypothetical protein
MPARAARIDILRVEQPSARHCGRAQSADLATAGNDEILVIAATITVVLCGRPDLRHELIEIKWLA